MNEAVVAFVWLLAMAVALPLFVSALRGWFGIWRTKAIQLSGQVPNICILIPPHGEAKIVAHSLARLVTIFDASKRAVVVADRRVGWVRTGHD